MADADWGPYSYLLNKNFKQEVLPLIPNGGLQAMGIWPAPGHEDSIRLNQAAYVTMIKRHFDAICVAAVYIKWPDDFSWVLCVKSRPKVPLCV